MMTEGAAWLTVVAHLRRCKMEGENTSMFINIVPRKFLSLLQVSKRDPHEDGLV